MVEKKVRHGRDGKREFRKIMEDEGLDESLLQLAKLKSGSSMTPKQSWVTSDAQGHELFQ